METNIMIQMALLDPNSITSIPLTIENLLIYMPIIFSGIVTVATLIVRLTPSVRDNNFFLPILKFLGKWIALNRDPAIDNEFRKNNPVK